MSNFEFFVYSFDFWKYIAILCIVTLLYLVVFKRSFIGVFEPFSYYLFFSIMAASTGLFVVLDDDVDVNILLQFLGTQILFILGYLACVTPKFNQVLVSRPFLTRLDEVTVIIFVSLLSFFIVSLQVYIYLKHGFPLFSHSRLSFADGDIVSGLLLRIKSIFFFPLVFAFYILAFQCRYRLFKNLAILLLFIFIVFSILDGSKSALVIFLLIFGLYSYISKMTGFDTPYQRLKRFWFLILSFSILTACLIVYLSKETASILVLIFSRFVMAGDIFYMAYPNDTYKLFIPHSEWYVNLFSSPASWLGLVSSSDVPYPLGFQLMSYHEGVQMTKGPNPRMNVFGLVYIGYYGSFIYAFFAGFIMAVLRNLGFIYFTKSSTLLVFYVALVFCAIKIEPDFFNFLAALINLLPLAFTLFFSRVIADIIIRRN
jgi:hypothetical protein